PEKWQRLACWRVRLVPRRRTWKCGRWPEEDRACLRQYALRPDRCESSRLDSAQIFPPGLVSFHLGQTADAVPFKTSMKGRTGQLRDRDLQRIQAIVERQQCVLAKGDDDGLLLHGQNRRPWRLRSGRKVGHRATLAPLGHRLGVDAVTPRQRPQALLTMPAKSA